MTLAALLDRPGAKPTEVADLLDGLPAAERLGECTGLSAARQKRLWEMASADPRAGGEFVGAAASATAVFAGRNSLPLWSRFQKRFTRQGSAVIGYNQHALARLIGPGYFTVEPPTPGRGFRFDYSRLPSAVPPGWPAVVANSRFLSRPVYGALIDEVVWVSADVLVGSAFRAEAALDSYFVLVRLVTAPPPRAAA